MPSSSLGCTSTHAPRKLQGSPLQVSKSRWASQPQDIISPGGIAIRWGLSLSAILPMLSASPLVAQAVGDDVEYAELPPPYIPLIFAVGLLAGVGLLTGSLGDVMDEESSLGLQSGARAKKEIERSRSSYFKKK